MELKNLKVERRESWEPKDKPLYGGVITMEGKSNLVTFQLTEDQAQEILKIVAQGAINTAKEAANALLTCFEEKRAIAVSMPEAISFVEVDTPQDKIPF